MKWHRVAWTGGRWLVGALWTLVVWTLWLGLALLLALQVYVATSRDLNAPSFVLRALERRLAASGTHATFGRTTFDPSGRVLMENVAVTLPGFEEPVVTARAIYARFDPWALLFGRFEPEELRVTGMSLRVPAMLSPSGRADEVVRDLDAAFLPRGRELGVSYLNFKLGDVDIAARGAVHLPAARAGGAPPLPLAEFLSRNYAGLSRELDDAMETLATLDHPVVRVELSPSETSGAAVGVTLLAAGLTLPEPVGLHATALQFSGELPFVAASGVPVTTELDFATEELDLPRGIVAHGVRARLHVRLPPGRLRFDRDVFHDVELSAADLAGGGLAIEAPLVSLVAGPLPRVRVGIRALVGNAPLALRAKLDVATGTADVRFEGGVSPRLLAPIGAHLGRDLRKYAELTSPIAVAGEAWFGPGWKFVRTDARVAARAATVWHVRLDEARGRIEFDGRRLAAPELYVRLGDNWAGGSYEQDVATRDYRFLLVGSLRPPVIGPWFPPQSWWHELFRPFAFPGAPPAADADVRGCWTNSRQAMVFVAVDGAGPVYRGVPFDRLRTRLFIRPSLDDGLDFSAVSGARSARGTFAYRRDVDAGTWQSSDFDVASTFDLGSAAKLLGPKGAALLEPFVFARPPVVHVAGHLDGAAAPGGAHESVHVEAQSDGPFHFHDFPFARVAFTADVRDDVIAVSRFEAGFAGGDVTGHGQLSGRGTDGRLAFSAALHGASLGQAIGGVQEFAAKRAHRAQPQATAFVKDKSSVRLDLEASGTGRSDDFLSYQGTGQAALRGAELGEVRMLGLFTELLPFASLRFTAARADFKIDGANLVFPSVNVTGANSAIEAHGTYDLDRHRLDFNAKFFPFLKSKSLPQELMGKVLAPLSEFLQVKLSGSLDNPQWVFENGPSNFLHKLAPPAPSAVAAPSAPVAVPTSPPPPPPAAKSAKSGN